MNDNIDRIALKSGLIVEEYNGFDKTYLDTAEAIFSVMLIKECARIAVGTLCTFEGEISPQVAHAWDMACAEAANNIRKHFDIL
jgi:hypothetical protein